MADLLLGMPTLVELSDLPACTQLCKELGFSFVEINMNLPMYQVHRLSAPALKALAQMGIGFTFHLDEGFDPADFNPLVAQAYLDTLSHTLEVALAIGAPIVNLHLSEGVHFKLPGEKVFLYERYSDTYLAAMARVKALCQQVIGKEDLLVCLENTGGFMAFQREAVDLLLASPHFGLTLDVGHDHCAGGVDWGFIMDRKARLRHMHLHDAQDARCHLPLGDGVLAIPNLLSLAGAQACRCVLETKSIAGLRQSVAYLNHLNA